MNNKVLYEPGSVRGDAGILYLTKNQPAVIPFYFKIPLYDTTQETYTEYNIKSTDVIEFVFKANINLISATIKKAYNGIVNNVAVLRLTESDMKLFANGKEYMLGVKLYDNSGKLIETLIKKLQVKIQEVV